jgi:hypothetical protein
MAFEDCDEGLEQRPVQPVAVKVMRGHVRRRHEHDPLVEQRRKQPRQNHRIGDVGDGEFVEAQHPGFVGQRPRHRRNRVVALGLTRLDGGAVSTDPVVHIGHEVVEMDPPLAVDRRQVVKQVHQHGLAAPDRAVDVQSLDRRLRLAPAREQPAERTRFGCEALGRQVLDQPVEPVGDFFLRAITLHRAALDPIVIGLAHRGKGFESVAQRHGPASISRSAWKAESRVHRDSEIG